MSTTAHRGGFANKKYKAACDKCHVSKVKCQGGGPPCVRCAENSYSCNYSLTARIGKPPGCKNRRTLERLHHPDQMRLERDSGDASVDRDMDLQEERGGRTNPRDGIQASNTRAPLPSLSTMEHSNFSGSSQSSQASPPLAQDLFDVDDTLIDNSDMSALWSNDMGVADLGELDKEVLGLPWAGSSVDNWNIDNVRIPKLPSRWANKTYSSSRWWTCPNRPRALQISV